MPNVSLLQPVLRAACAECSLLQPRLEQNRSISACPKRSILQDFVRQANFSLPNEAERLAFYETGPLDQRLSGAAANYHVNVHWQWDVLSYALQVRRHGLLRLPVQAAILKCSCAQEAMTALQQGPVPYEYRNLNVEAGWT